MAKPKKKKSNLIELSLKDVTLIAVAGLLLSFLSLPYIQTTVQSELDKLTGYTADINVLCIGTEHLITPEDVEKKGWPTAYNMNIIQNPYGNNEKLPNVLFPYGISGGIQLNEDQKYYMIHVSNPGRKYCKNLKIDIDFGHDSTIENVTVLNTNREQILQGGEDTSYLTLLIPELLSYENQTAIVIISGKNIKSVHAKAEGIEDINNIFIFDEIPYGTPNSPYLYFVPKSPVARGL